MQHCKAATEKEISLCPESAEYPKSLIHQEFFSLQGAHYLALKLYQQAMISLTHSLKIQGAYRAGVRKSTLLMVKEIMLKHGNGLS